MEKELALLEIMNLNLLLIILFKAEIISILRVYPNPVLFVSKLFHLLSFPVPLLFSEVKQLCFIVDLTYLTLNYQHRMRTSARY